MFKKHKTYAAFSRFLTTPLRKRKRRQIRLMMRGYRYLKHDGRLHIIEDTVQHLREYELQISFNSLSVLLWGHALPSSEIILRQRLASRYLVLTRAILIASSKSSGCLIAPFPKPWRNELQRLGFRLDRFRSSSAWSLYLIRHIFQGIYSALSILKDSVFVRHSVLSMRKSYIYFCDLVSDNIPSAANNYTSDCILGWYSHWSGRRNDIESLRHSVPNIPSASLGTCDLTYQQSPIPALNCRIQQIRFLLAFFRTVPCILISLCRRHWWNILIYPESIMSLLVQCQTAPLAKEYWFHNSRFYPPLWTYELPLKGSKSVYYFYSTNCEPFQIRTDGSCPFITPYSITNWPEYLVWDYSQYQFIRKCCGDFPKVSVVGPISFSANSNSLPCSLPKRSIAVFDVQPHRDSLYQRLGFANEFYVPDQCIAFFEDILTCAIELNATLLVKRKREIGPAAHPSYRKYVALMASCKNVVFIDPGISAATVIDSSMASISMPYTSSAIVAREKRIPSVYYLPSNKLVVDISLSHGIQVICGISDLKSWMQLMLS